MQARTTKQAKGTQPPGKQPSSSPQRKRPLSRPPVIATLIIALMLCIGVGGTAAWAYSYNNQSDLSWYTANTSAEEFTISNNGQLHAFSALVNGDAKDAAGNPLPAVSFEGKTVRMASGLNLYNVEFTPIGTAAHPFAGTFVGAPIQRLQITAPPSNENIGFFGYTAPTAYITGVQLQANCNIILSTDQPSVNYNNIGGIVGSNNGTISGCSSAAKVSIVHRAIYLNVEQGGTGRPVVASVGGIAGLSNGPIAGVTHSGKVEVTAAGGAYNTPDSLGAAEVNVVASIGGVVGTANAAISNNNNQGTVYTATTGLGVADRFNMVADVKAYNVGGIAGYSHANIDKCTNSGNILTTGTPVSFDNPQASLDVLATAPKSHAMLQSSGGGTGVGGIVGNFRAIVGYSEAGGGMVGGNVGVDLYAPFITLSDCSNTGIVHGLHVVGGIAGGAGNNTVITRCSNGIATNQTAGLVRTTRWNKPCTGGISGQSCGTISYSRNHAEITTTKIGYYNAGITGLLGQYQGQPYRSEMYACYSTGPITTGWRPGGLAGVNYGYIHDNVFLFGTVNAGIGDTADQVAVHVNQGSVMYSTYAYETKTQALNNKGMWIKSGDTIAVLNKLSPKTDWTNYYFLSPNINNGYPILNGEAPEEGTVNLELVALDLTLEKHATYTAAYNPAPTLTASIVIDGQTVTLMPNVDFRVVADSNALNEDGICKGTTNGEALYDAHIEGIGLYSGKPLTSAKYAILKGNLAESTLVAANTLWTGVAQNNPIVDVIDPGGNLIAASNYRITVNNDNGCVNVGIYPVTASAVENSNYEGAVTGQYRIATPNLYADADTVGIYLEGYTVSGVANSKSVWYFNEENSKIYEVIPVLEAGELQWVRPGDGNFNSPVFGEDGTLLWELATAGQGLILVEGMETYMTADERLLTRATPLRTDAETGQPLYGDMEVAYSGDMVIPVPIAVLYNGSLLSPENYWPSYGVYSDTSVRAHPYNMNPTISEEQPEASLVIRGTKNFTNYNYIDFKIRSIEIESNQVEVVQKTFNLPYSSGGLPVVPAKTTARPATVTIPNVATSAVYGSVIAHSYAEVRYLPNAQGYDANDPATYEYVSADQWSLVFDHAVAVDGTTSLNEESTGYEPGAKVYYRIEFIEKAGLIVTFDEPLLLELTIVNPNGNGDVKTPLDSGVLEVRAPAYDPTKSMRVWLESIELYDTVRGVPLKVRTGAANTDVAQGNQYFVTSRSYTSVTYNIPTFNPVTGLLEASFGIEACSAGNYTGTYTVNYACEPIRFPAADNSIFLSTARWQFAEKYADAYGQYVDANTPFIARLPYTKNGWTAEQLSETISLALLPNGVSGSKISVLKGFTVDSIANSAGTIVDSVGQDGTYTLNVRYIADAQTANGIFLGADNPNEVYKVKVVVYMQATPFSATLNTWANNGFYVFRSITLATSEYMYTGAPLDIQGDIVAIDAHGDRIDPAYLPVVVVSTKGSKYARGSIKEVGAYNDLKDSTASSHNYYDVNLAGDGIHYYTAANATNPDTAVTTTGVANRICRDYDENSALPINLQFSIVAADISDPSKVRIELDPATQAVSFFDAKTGKALSYLQGVDYSLTWREERSTGMGYACFSSSGNGNLVGTLNGERRDLPNGTGTYYYYEVPFELESVGIDAQDVTWDYAKKIAAIAADTLAVPSVVGSYQGTTIPADAYEVELGVWDEATGAFSEKTTGWSDGDIAYLRVTGTNLFVCTGEVFLPVSIVAPDPTKTFGGAEFEGSISASSPTFTAHAVTPTITITVEGVALVEGRDFSVSCASVNAGADAGEATITGLGEYTGQIKKCFTIQPADIATSNALTVVVKPQYYTGAQVTFAASEIEGVYFNEVKLASTDWLLDAAGFGANLTVASGGTFTLNAAASGNLTGTMVVPFKIAPKPFTDDIIIANITSQTYKGTNVVLDASALSLVDAGRSNAQLVLGQDYAIVGYSNNLNVSTLATGSATIYLSGMGNYAADNNKLASFEIIAAELDASIASGILNQYWYQGYAVKPTPQVTLGGVTLPDTNYKVEYGANDTIGVKTGWVTITPVGNNVSGQAARFEFDITADIGQAAVEALPNATYVPGGSYAPNLMVTYQGQELIQGTHYTVDYGTYGAGAKTLTITGVETAAAYGSRTISYSIAGRPLASSMAQAVAAQSYSGFELKPEPVLVDGDYALVKGVDYTLSYTNNINASKGSSTAQITVHGTGNYAGVFTVPFAIDAHEFTQSELQENFVSIAASGLWAGSGAVGAQLELYDTRITLEGFAAGSLSMLTAPRYYRLVEGTDYRIESYARNTEPGTGTVTVKGIGNYDFTLTAYYEIHGNIAAARLAAISQQTWTGAALRPAVAVALGSKTLVEGTDYAVTYANNTAEGTATATVTGMGLYVGTTATGFVIAKPVDTSNNANNNTAGNTTNNTANNTTNSNNNYYYGSTTTTTAAAPVATTATTTPGVATATTSESAATQAATTQDKPNATAAQSNNIEDTTTPLATTNTTAPATANQFDWLLWLAIGLVIVALAGALLHLYQRNRRLVSEIERRD